MKNIYCLKGAGGTIKWLLAIQSMNGPLDRVVVAAEVPINNCVI